MHHGSFEVTVTSVSLPPFVSRRGLSNTNQRLSHTLALTHKQDSNILFYDADNGEILCI